MDFRGVGCSGVPSDKITERDNCHPHRNDFWLLRCDRLRYVTGASWELWD